MKKLLSLLGAIGLVASTGSSIVSCSGHPADKDDDGDTSKWDAMTTDKLVNLVYNDIDENNKYVNEENYKEIFKKLFDGTKYIGKDVTLDSDEIGVFQNTFNEWLNDSLYREIHYTIKRLIKEGVGFKEGEDNLKSYLVDFASSLNVFKEAPQLSSFFPLFDKWINMCSEAKKIKSL